MFGLASQSYRCGMRPLVITSASQISDLEIQYDASQSTASTFNSGVITSGTEVSSWHNSGTLATKDWNSTGGRRPEWFNNIQNGLGVVRFNNSGSTPSGEDADTNESLSINPITTLRSLSGTTLVLVYRSLSTSAGRRIITTTDTSGFQFGQNGTQYIGSHAGGTFSIDSVTVDTNFHHMIMVFDGTQTGNANRLKIRLDSVDVGLTFSVDVGTQTNPSSNTFYGGTDTNGNSNFFIGDIGECFIYRSALTTGQILAVEQYLTNKWAI